VLQLALEWPSVVLTGVVGYRSIDVSSMTHEVAMETIDESNNKSGGDVTY